MIRRTLVIIALAGSLAADPDPHAPRVLFEDTFSQTIDPIRNRYGSDNGDFAYRVGYSAEATILGNLSRPSEGKAPLSGVSGALKFTSDGAEMNGNSENVAQLAAYFERTSISVGETIQFSADLSIYTKAAATLTTGINNMMRFGLVNMESSVTNNWNREPADEAETVTYEGTGASTFLGTGFMANLQTGGSPATTRLNAVVQNRSVDNRLATNSAGWTSLTDTQATWNIQEGNLIGDTFNDGVDVKLSQTIERISSDVFRVNASLNSQSWDQAIFHSYLFDANGAGEAYTTFATLFFTANGGGAGIYRSLIDNISVAVVPEPSKAFLCLIGLWLLAFRRQRKA